MVVVVVFVVICMLMYMLQACAYKVGEIKIRELRKKAEQKLGMSGFKRILIFMCSNDVKAEMNSSHHARTIYIYFFFRGEV